MSATVVDDSSCVLSCSSNSGTVSTSCLSNVTALSLDVESSLLVNVTAKRISAKSALLYNVVDESEEGIIIGEGQARADVLIDGERVILLCEIEHDGRVSWKTTLPNNKRSFEEVWKANQTQDVIASLKSVVESHAEARKRIKKE